VAATVMAAAAAASPIPPVPSTNPPRAELSAVACVKALDPVGRSVSVTATMRPLKGTQKLSINVKLLDKAAGLQTWSPVTGPGLGQWLSPTDPPTLGQRPADVWNVRHPVTDLTAPVAYRFSVQFRWFGTGGKVLGGQTLSSDVCQQPELRPDLVVGTVAVTSAGRRTRRAYTTTISNTGATAASQILVELNVAGTIVPQTIKRLAPHSSQRLKFTGPACNAAVPASVIVDPNDQIDVSSRAQAVAQVNCTATPVGTNGAPVSG
jgi:CARDB